MLLAPMGFDKLELNSVRFSFPPNDAILNSENDLLEN